MEEALQEIATRWKDIADDIGEITIQPYKKDIHVTLFGIAWRPVHVVDAAGRPVELPGFTLENE